MRKISMIIGLIGLFCIGCSLYIKHEIAKGNQQVDSAQEKLDGGKRLFSIAPGSEPVGDILGSPIQNQIDAGKIEIEKATTIATWLLGSGLILAAASLGALIIHTKK